MKFVLALLGAVLLSTSAMAAGYKESVSGDLSDDGLNPTPVALKIGDSIIDAESGNAERDYFAVRIKPGTELIGIGVHPATSVGGNSSFIGVQVGRQVTVDPNAPSADELLGWTHFTTSDEGRNILPDICTGDGAIGCTPPLGAGIYSFWVQELGNCACHYRLVFRVRQLAAD